MADSNHYQTLGVAADATPRAIRTAYRRLARLRHPDTPTGDQGKMVELNLAYETLMDPVSRAAYDRGLRVAASPRRRPRAAATASDPLVFLAKVFQPADARVRKALDRIEQAISDLAGDLYDDACVAAFERSFLEVRMAIDQIERQLRAQEWPAGFAAARGFYLQGLRHVEDALEDFAGFLESYDSDCIVSGQDFLAVGQKILATARRSFG